MKQRSILSVTILSIVTFGIYMLLWLKETRDEMVAKGAKIPRFLIFLIPVLLPVILIFAQLAMRYLLVSNSSDFSAGDPARMILNIISIIVGIALVLGFVPLTLYWIYRYCQGVELITKGHSNAGFSFLLFVVCVICGVGFIWPAVMQDVFNKLPHGKHHA